MVIGIVAVYLTVQFLQTYVLEPVVVGQQVNINPLFTIMGLVAGEFLWGIAGMALAIPLLGIVKIVCDNVPGLQAYGKLVGPANTPKKRQSFFQRSEEHTSELQSLLRITYAVYCLKKKKT